MDLSGIPPSKNFEDRTGQQMMADLIHHLLLSPEEKEMMKKNQWSVKDILILRDAMRNNAYPHRKGIDAPPPPVNNIDVRTEYKTFPRYPEIPIPPKG